MLQTLFSIFAASTALTSSYQSKTLEVGGFTELVLYLKHTTGASETSAALVLKIEFSPDGTNFYQTPDSNNAPTTYSYPGGAGSTAYPIRVPIAIADKYIKISVKDSGVSSNHGTLLAQAFATDRPQAFGLGQSTAGGSSGGGGDVQTAGADAESNTANAQRTASRMYGFNGTTWDRLRTAVITATSTVTGWLNILDMGKYDASSPTLTDGQFYPRRVTVNGASLVSLFDLLGGEDLTNNVLGIVNKPIAASTYSLSRSAIFASDVDVSAKAAAGNIFSAHAHNINASIRYLHIFNKASAPAGSDVPVFSFAIPAGTANQPGDRLIGTDFFGTAGYYLSTGVAYGVSTVNATFTAATTTDHNEHVMYI